MRSKIINFIALLSIFGAVAACQDESTFYEEESSKGEITVDSTDIGYLQLSNFEIIVDESAEELLNTETRSATRASSYDFWVTIESTNLKVPVSMYMTYDEFLEEVNDGEGYPLASGDYKTTIDTKDGDVEDIEQTITVGDDNADLGEARYKGSQSFTIVKGSTTTVDDIVCTLSNVVSSVTLSADLKALFKTDKECSDDDLPLRVNITMGNKTYTFSREDYDKVVYFDPIEDSGNEIEIVLSGMYNTASADQDPTYAKIEEWKQTVSDVEVGQWRKINIHVLHANEGNIEFEVTVENWVYDDVIDVNIMSLYSTMEETILDPEAMPKIEINGSSDNALFVSTSNETVEPIVSYFTPRNKESLQSVTVKESNIADGGEITLWPMTDSNYSYLFEVEEDPTSKKLTITATEACMELLTDLPEGIKGKAYTPSFTAIDNRDYTTTEAYQITVGEATVPTIEWVGYDLTQQYELSMSDNSTFEVVINVESDSGITEFLLDIESEVLTPEELASINLAQSMDLINPGDCENGLLTLGFPVKDQVEGQTSVSFDITTFIPLLKGLGVAESNFIMKVTNSAGGTTEATIMLKVVE